MAYNIQSVPRQTDVHFSSPPFSYGGHKQQASPHMSKLPLNSSYVDSCIYNPSRHAPSCFGAEFGAGCISECNYCRVPSTCLSSGAFVQHRSPCHCEHNQECAYERQDFAAATGSFAVFTSCCELYDGETSIQDAVHVHGNSFTTEVGPTFVDLHGVSLVDGRQLAFGVNEGLQLQEFFVHDEVREPL